MVQSLFQKYGLGWILSASVVMFISTNFVNVGNLVFNLLFSRWMGPALFSDLALLLTIKLSILGILNAVQFLVTEKVAEASSSQKLSFETYYRWLAKTSSIAIFLILPALIYYAVQSHLAERVNLNNQTAMIVFFFGFPFYLPLALWRGFAQGKVDIHRIVYSANAEMLVRLFGAIALWWLGFGLNGVMIAFVLSLLAAWWFALPPKTEQNPQRASSKDALPWVHTLPWAAIQLAVVLALDGDVFVTKFYMDAEEAGLIAAISLIQRIIFFASFALATILLPQVIAEIKIGKMGAKRALPILGLITLSVVPVLLVLHLFPELAVSLLFGTKFLSIGPNLSSAALSATLITLSYFTCVFMMAHKEKRIAFLLLLLSLGQLAFLSYLVNHQDAKVTNVVNGKLIYQMLSTFLIILASALAMFYKYNIGKDMT